MSKQAAGGNKKRKRKPRPQHKILAAEIRKEKRIRHHAVNPKFNKKSKKYGIIFDFGTPKCHIRPTTFEDMYRTYRVTKGRQGLNPNPTTRQDENPWVVHIAIWCGVFPIQDLMEKHIQYSKLQKY